MLRPLCLFLAASLPLLLLPAGCRTVHSPPPALTVVAHRPVGWGGVAPDIDLLPLRAAAWPGWANLRLVLDDKGAHHLRLDSRGRLTAAPGLPVAWRRHPRTRLVVTGDVDGAPRAQNVTVELIDIGPEVQRAAAELLVDVPAQVTDLAQVYEALRGAIANAVAVPTPHVTLFGVHKVSAHRLRLLAAVTTPRGAWMDAERLLHQLRSRLATTEGLTLSFIVQGSPSRITIIGGCLPNSCFIKPTHVRQPFLSKTITMGGTYFVLNRLAAKSRMKRNTDKCNGRGKCITEDYYGSQCRCKCQYGYNGPNCEQLKYTIEGTSSFTIDPKIRKNSELHLSFEFKTSDVAGNGALLILGPSASTSLISTFTISLDAGRPTLIVTDANSTNIKIVITEVFNDGRWYRLDVLQEEKKLTFLLDLCEERPDRKIADICREVKEFTNGMDFSGSALTIGNSSLSGCLANIRVNGVLQDLHDPNRPLSSNSHIGCLKEEISCFSGSKYGKCGEHSICNGMFLNTSLYECQCLPGYRSAGNNNKSACNIPMNIFRFKDNSSVQWEMQMMSINHASLLNKAATRFQVSFRTLSVNATLMSYHKHYLKVLIFDSHPRLEVLLKGLNKPLILTLGSANASDGEWHTLTVNRIIGALEMSMDRGEHYAFKYQFIDLNNAIILDSLTRIGGYGSVDVDGENKTFDFQGCMRGVRMFTNWFWIPLSESEITINGLEYMQNVASKEVEKVAACNASDLCTVVCRKDQERIVRGPGDCQCRCHKGTFEILGACLPSVCAEPNPCHNGTCTVVSEEDRDYNCTCYTGYYGENCTLIIPPLPPTAPPLVMGGIPWWVFLFIALALLLLFVLLLLLFFWRRREKSEEPILAINDIDSVPENLKDYCIEGAGEEDFPGYIDFNLLRKPTAPPVPNGKMPDAPDIPQMTAPLMTNNPALPTATPDWKNPELDNGDHLDHTLEYGYEGQGSYLSLSSIASGSTDQDLEFDHLRDWGHRFDGLSNLYRRGAD